jgi:hypothetical protein
MTTKLKGSRLDRVAISLIILLAILIGLLLWNGDRTVPRVKNFNLENQQVTAADNALVLTFNRPMNQASVEANLKFTPKLIGKTSWAGRRMAFTLTEPLVYGQSYKIELQSARDRFSEQTNIQPYSANFSTPEPAFVYIGSTGEEADRLVLYNFTHKFKRILTSSDLKINDFCIANRKQILIGATPKGIDFVDSPANVLDQNLYILSTDLDAISPTKSEIKLILDNSDYQNLKFDLSANGENIVVYRLSRPPRRDYGLWLINKNRELIDLKNQAGGEFTIAPNSVSVAIAQGAGIAILPLEPNAKPYDFFPKFGSVLGFNSSGTQVAMVKFNNDYTRSLYLLNNQGKQEELLKISGSILEVKFSPREPIIYCLLTDAIQSKNSYQERLYLAAIATETKQLTRILDLPDRLSSELSMSPDGTALLIDLPPSLDRQTNQQINQQTGQRVSVEPSLKNLQNLRLIQIASSKSEPTTKVLDLFGSRPQWLP